MHPCFFLTLFGATLYGTETPDKSDLDVRGVFLPSLESLALGQAPHSLHLSTADAKGRNAAHDVDLDLWSIQHWLLKLLPAGDMAGLDLLFAPSHTACTLYRNPRLDKVFAAPLRFLDLTGRGYAAYVFKQTEKYGVKGSRAGALKAVRAWLAAHYPKPAPNERLGDCLDALAAACVNDRHCFLTEITGKKPCSLAASCMPLPLALRNSPAGWRRSCNLWPRGLQRPSAMKTWTSKPFPTPCAPWPR